MTEQLFWEDIAEGAAVPPLVKHPTPRQLVQWAGATGDFYEIHYDRDYAVKNGLPGIIVHGALKGAWLGQMLGDWVGEKGKVKKYGCSYRGMDVPGDTLTCGGKVTRKHFDGKDNIVEAEIWLHNGKGEITTPGTAIVVFPSRAGK